MELRFITTEDPLYAGERALRFEVLRRALGLAAGSEVFPFDAESLHLVALEGGEVVGCVLFHADEPGGAVGRLFQMAVTPSLQGKGLGRRLVEGLEAELRARGVREVYLHARAEVTGFYEALGYGGRGAPFVEVGILHQEMHKRFD